MQRFARRCDAPVEHVEARLATLPDRLLPPRLLDLRTLLPDPPRSAWEQVWQGGRRPGFGKGMRATCGERRRVCTPNPGAGRNRPSSLLEGARREGLRWL